MSVDVPRTSAGLLPFLVTDAGEVRVFIAHMGGPLWARRPRSWSIVKGEYDPAAEDPLAAAEREFLEEVGVPAPAVPATAPIDLGEVRQSGGKVVRVLAVRADEDLAFVASNTFEMEWPPRSGRRRSFPEVDRAEWCAVADARERLVSAQTVALDRLLDVLGVEDIP